MSVRQLILRHLPDFCWQSAEEIFLMLEIIDDGIWLNSVSVILVDLKDRKLIEAKKAPSRKSKRIIWYYKGLSAGSLQGSR